MQNGCNGKKRQVCQMIDNDWQSSRFPVLKKYKQNSLSLSDQGHGLT